MHLRNLAVVACTFLFVSCNTIEQKAVTADESLATQEKISSAVDLTGCYKMAIGRDTAFMQLTQNRASVSGPLVYQRFEKDSNKGNVVLSQDKGKLSGWYSFSSEGKVTVRQIKFMIVNAGLAEAYGDISMRNDSAVFHYPSAVQFEENHPFIKIDCEK